MVAEKLKIMKTLTGLISTFLFFFLFFAGKPVSDNWLVSKQEGYKIYYKSPDKESFQEYARMIDQAEKQVRAFFNSDFQKEFSVFVHPDRASLDVQLSNDWGMPEFKTECWMVASGVSTKMDILSPKNWDRLACEHSYNDTLKTRQLITHELIHVFHGQQNNSPDFSDVTGIDWFVEGLAVYGSGQYDFERIASVTKAVAEDTYPKTLDDFWTGKLKYGFSGSMVMYIDKKVGRGKLNELLIYNRKIDLLNHLGMSETELLTEWKTFILKYHGN
jgi:hypothetical protein